MIFCQKTLKAIVKYRKHPSIIPIASEFTKKCFPLNASTTEDAIKEICMLDSSKAIQANDMPENVITGNSIFFCRTNTHFFQ